MIRAIIRKKKFFILNSQLFSDKAILVKGKWILTYLFSNNLQIKLWHHRVKYALNARIIKVSKLINNINIMIEDNQQRSKRYFFSNSKNNHKNNISKPSLNSNNIPYLTFTTMLFNKIISITNHNNFVKQLYNLYIENKYTKIIKHNKMILIIFKLQKIYANL